MHYDEDTDVFKQVRVEEEEEEKWSFVRKKSYILQMLYNRPVLSKWRNIQERNRV